MEKFVEQTLLYDFYGELLTAHQRRIYEDVVLNDYSLSEVADELGISRQGVHDNIKRCNKALQDYEIEMKVDRAFSLIFGNEATGLPDTYSEIGQSILINYLHEVDSLNLSIATGIGLYEFTKKYFKQFVST